MSRKLDEAKRRKEQGGRERRKKRQKTGKGTGTHCSGFMHVRGAGCPTQHKVLNLLKLAGQFAVEKGFALRNVADDKRLRRQFPKNKPTVDSWLEDESRYIYSKTKELPLSEKGAIPALVHVVASLRDGDAHIRQRAPARPEQGKHLRRQAPKDKERRA